jgi:hypothetical protein
MAPAVLKSIALKAGKTSATIDLNIQAVNFINALGEEDRFKVINFFHHGEVSIDVYDHIYNLFSGFAQQILEHQPSIVGISLFTYNCQTSAEYMAFLIKKLSPETKVIMGGAGLTNNLIGVSHYAENLLQTKLIDFYIRGDGEQALYNYLTTERTDLPGINQSAWQELTNDDLVKLPPPDYDDYNFDEYSKRKVISVLGSRGCVRNCTFCDIHAHWTKFSWRSGEHIFEEMKMLNQKYGIRSFLFQDSLINGNMKEYRALMRLIADYNKSVNPDQKLEWSSYFILRPVKQFTEEDWKLTAEGGAKILTIGIESLSDTARFHLGKKFTNTDVDFGLTMARKYNIKFMMLFLTGYITESEADVDAACEWWEDHKDYKDVMMVNLGVPLGILKGTPLDENFKEWGLQRIGPDDQDWVNPATDNTPSNRVRWHRKLVDTVTRLGFEQHGGADNRFIIERMVMKDTAHDIQ